MELLAVKLGSLEEGMHRGGKRTYPSSLLEDGFIFWKLAAQFAWVLWVSALFHAKTSVKGRSFHPLLFSKNIWIAAWRIDCQGGGFLVARIECPECVTIPCVDSLENMLNSIQLLLIDFLKFHRWFALRQKFENAFPIECCTRISILQGAIELTYSSLTP